MGKKLSIVISTHNRFDLIKNAIQSFCVQNISKDYFEIIIVDNNPESNNVLRDMVLMYSDKLLITYIREPRTGLSYARNAGGKAATTDWVGYVDDDAEVSEAYISKAIKITDKFNPDFFGGPYYPFYISTKPKWFKDEYETGISATESRYLNSKEFLNGTNMIFKKSLLEKLNWFDVTYGMSGNKIAFGEETALQLKAWKENKNLKVYYDKELVVSHMVPPGKLKLPDRYKRKYNTGKSQAYLWIEEQKIKKTRLRAPFVIFKTVVLMIVKGYPLFFFYNRKKFMYWQNYAYEVFSQYFASLGQEWKYTIDLLRRN